jgi:putative transposase
VIGGLSISPKRRRLGFYFRLHAKNISHDEVHDFLWYLLRHLRGHVVVIWDGASIHHAKGLSEFCRQYPRLHLEKLPAYAPELNPIEAAWHAVKHPLANGRPDSIPQLGRTLLASLRNARASQRVLCGCITQSELPPFLP